MATHHSGQLEISSEPNVINQDLEQRIRDMEYGLSAIKMDAWWAWARRDDGYLVGVVIRSENISPDSVKFNMHVYSNTTDVYRTGGCVVPILPCKTEEEMDAAQALIEHEIENTLGVIMTLVEEGEHDVD